MRVARAWLGCQLTAIGAFGLVGCSDEAFVTEPPGGEPWTHGSPLDCTANFGSGAAAELYDLVGLRAGSGIDESSYASFAPRIEMDPARLARHHELQAHPLALSCEAGNVALRADRAAQSRGPREALVANAAAELGLLLDVGPPASPSSSTPSASSSVARLVDVLVSLGAELTERDRERLSQIPEPLARALETTLDGAREAAGLRESALRAFGDPERYFDGGPAAWLVWPGDVAVDPGAEVRWHERSDAARILYQGAARLARAVDDAGYEELGETGGRLPAEFECVVSTRLGKVVLRGDESHVYDAEEDPRLAGPLLLVVDTGGDDDYRIPAGATSSPDHAVAVHVDLGGDDRYGYREASVGDRVAAADADGRYHGEGAGPLSLSTVGRQGSGRLGYGYLIDLGGGDDEYHSLRMSQGFAALGVGLLWDDDGDDRYESETASQGASLVGLGILFDGGGSDSYRAFMMAQGFGGVSSYGLLYDAAGADSYELVVDEPVMLGSHQTEGESNVSLGQGVGMGWRDDDGERHLSGGIGILRDLGGDDAFVGGTFAQGAGYWMGFGILADGAGNDAYDSVFYGNGAAAHFALAAFLDTDGDDTYGAAGIGEQSIYGLGHDYAVGVFVDDAGDDRYRAPIWSLGASTCRSFGLFVDNGGRDEYTSPAETSLGAAGDTCDDAVARSVGLFLDAGGDDTYAARGENGQWWVQAVVPGRSWHGAGIDGVGGSTVRAGEGLAPGQRAMAAGILRP